MVMLPTFDVTAAQRVRIVAALRMLTNADPATTDADVYRMWLKNTLLDTVKIAERVPLNTQYRNDVQSQDAQVETDLGGLA